MVVNSSGYFGQNMFNRLTGANSPFVAGIQIGAPVVRWVAGQRLDSNAIEKRQQSIPLNDARVGADAVTAGLSRNDQNLVQIGEALISKALIKAEESSAVPDEITRNIAKIAIDHQIDPLDNNYLNSNDADQADFIIIEASQLKK